MEGAFKDCQILDLKYPPETPNTPPHLSSNYFGDNTRPKIIGVNYADDNPKSLFRDSQKIQTQTAYIFGVDKVVEYSPKDIPQYFYEKNKFLFSLPRGAGYWVWKPYVVRDALSKANNGDYVFYVDSGAFYIHDIHALIDAMENAKTDVMCFEGPIWFPERHWSKRDAFIIMDCDKEEYTHTTQRMSGFIFLKKTPCSVDLINEWMVYTQDPRINTDLPNTLGKENYEGFRENRHDQTAWSLITKKRGYGAFRDPSQWLFPPESKGFPEEVIARSTYPVMFYLYRRNIRRIFNFGFVPQFISVAKRIQNKERIPEQFQYGLTPAFQDGLAYHVSEYIKQYGSEKFPANLPPPKEILASYRELNLPEPPFLKEAVEKL